MITKSTPAVLFEIKSPLWNGGERKVGLALNRIQKHNKIVFTYRRKTGPAKGELSIPDMYGFDGDKLNQVDYDRMNVQGLTLVLIPFSDLEVVSG